MLRGLDEVEANLQRWYSGKLAGAAKAANNIAAFLEGYAKSHHPWKPDTGATDTSTRGFIADVTPFLIEIVLSAGMDYDVFLELAREGKWAWLWPAIEENLETIRSMIAEAME